MPSTLDPGDRKLLLIGGAILLLLIVATVVFAPAPDEEEGQGIPTTYSTANGGAQAAYLLLRELGYRSERWEKSPSELPADAEGKILILADPIHFPDKKERDALLRFVRAGGWIIYAGNVPFLFRRKRRGCASFLHARQRVRCVILFRPSLPALSLKAHRKSP